MISRTLSPEFYIAARESVIAAMRDRASNVLCTPRNHWTAQAARTYVWATTCLEAFINEVVEMNHPFMTPGKAFPVEEIQSLKLRVKFLLVPVLLGVETFEKGTRPFQDFDVLVRLRNDMVHYRMQSYPSGKGPKYHNWLCNAGAAFSSEGVAYTMWLDDVLTYRGSLWAYHTACDMTSALIQKIGPKAKAGTPFGLDGGGPERLRLDDEYAAMCEQYPPTGSTTE